MPLCTIRRADAADCAGILDCLRRAFSPYRDRYTAGAFADTVLTPETIRQRLASMTVFVAISSSGEIIGTIACGRVNEEDGHLRGMAVLPECQGRGISQELLKAAEEELRCRQCCRVTLDSTEPLERAMRFYENHGYRRSGRMTDFFGMPLFEYVKWLTPQEPRTAANKSSTRQSKHAD